MEPCICCGIPLSARQRREHLQIRDRALGAYLDAMEEVEQDDAPDGWDVDIPELGEIDMSDEEIGDEEGDGMNVPADVPAANLPPDRDDSPAFDDAGLAPNEFWPALNEIGPAPDELGPALGEIGPGLDEIDLAPSDVAKPFPRVPAPRIARRV
ncbi:hypothetical protein FRC09_018862 [Ceratobasidium sp. 395]|nr:hypothetical protein FRC09_018862 [Ceratobasidium sp. 395]